LVLFRKALCDVTRLGEELAGHQLIRRSQKYLRLCFQGDHWSCFIAEAATTMLQSGIYQLKYSWKADKAGDNIKVADSKLET